MKVKGFGAWPSRNVSSGGKRSSFDEYNKDLKGSEKNPSAEEYAGRKIEEYHHYSEIQDLTVEQDDNKKDDKKQKDESGKRRQRMAQQVMVLVVGSVMIVNSYNARVAKRAAQDAVDPNDSVVDTNTPDDNTDDNGDEDKTPQPSENAPQPTEDPTAATEGPTQPSAASPTRSNSSASAQSGSSSSGSGTGSSGAGSSSSASSESASSGSGSDTPGTSISWNWNADNSGASLVVTDGDGNIISESEATVTTSEEPATCRTEGRITYTASASANGQTYSDSRYETLPALGHAFNGGVEVTLDGGRTAMDYECTRCHEHFTIANSIDEE